jgi:hypothetical protein
MSWVHQVTIDRSDMLRTRFQGAREQPRNHPRAQHPGGVEHPRVRNQAARGDTRSAMISQTSDFWEKSDVLGSSGHSRSFRYPPSWSPGVRGQPRNEPRVQHPHLRKEASRWPAPSSSQRQTPQRGKHAAGRPVRRPPRLSRPLPEEAGRGPSQLLTQDATELPKAPQRRS